MRLSINGAVLQKLVASGNELWAQRLLKWNTHTHFGSIGYTIIGTIADSVLNSQGRQLKKIWKKPRSKRRMSRSSNSFIQWNVWMVKKIDNVEDILVLGVLQGTIWIIALEMFGTDCLHIPTNTPYNSLSMLLLSNLMRSRFFYCVCPCVV